MFFVRLASPPDGGAVNTAVSFARRENRIDRRTKSRRYNEGRREVSRWNKRRARGKFSRATRAPHSPLLSLSLAFFVKQVEIGVMLMEFREISANHMLSVGGRGGRQGPSQKY